MQSNTPDHVQESVNTVMRLYKIYLDGDLNFKAFSAEDLFDIEIDFKIADKYLDYIKNRGLSTLRQSLLARLTEI